MGDLVSDLVSMVNKLLVYVNSTSFEEVDKFDGGDRCEVVEDVLCGERRVRSGSWLSDMEKLEKLLVLLEDVLLARILAWDVLEVDGFSIDDRLRDVVGESDLAILSGREGLVSAPGHGPSFFLMLELGRGSQIPAGVDTKKEYWSVADVTGV